MWKCLKKAIKLNKLHILILQWEKQTNRTETMSKNWIKCLLRETCFNHISSVSHSLAAVPFPVRMPWTTNEFDPLRYANVTRTWMNQIYIWTHGHESEKNARQKSIFMNELKSNVCFLLFRLLWHAQSPYCSIVINNWEKRNNIPIRYLLWVRVVSHPHGAGHTHTAAVITHFAWWILKMESKLSISVRKRSNSIVNATMACDDTHSHTHTHTFGSTAHTVPWRPRWNVCVCAIDGFVCVLCTTHSRNRVELAWTMSYIVCCERDSQTKVTHNFILTLELSVSSSCLSAVIRERHTIRMRTFDQSHLKCSPIKIEEENVFAFAVYLIFVFPFFLFHFFPVWFDLVSGRCRENNSNPETDRACRGRVNLGSKWIIKIKKIRVVICWTSYVLTTHTINTEKMGLNIDFKMLPMKAHYFLYNAG